MSAVVNRRVLLESVSTLVKASAPTPAQLKAVYDALAQVTTDLTGDDCKIILKLGQGASQTTEGGSK